MTDLKVKSIAIPCFKGGYQSEYRDIRLSSNDGWVELECIPVKNIDLDLDDTVQLNICTTNELGSFSFLPEALKDFYLTHVEVMESEEGNYYNYNFYRESSPEDGEPYASIAIRGATKMDNLKVGKNYSFYVEKK